MATKDKLAAMLKEALAPKWMIDKAKAGGYDDYESQSATPIVDLVRDLKQAGIDWLAERAMNGDFDATKEEAEAWFEREGKDLL